MGPGVMQSELGAPIACLRRSPVGVGPLTGRDVGSRGIDREHAREVAIGVEHLDAMVRAITDVDVVSQVDGIECGMSNRPVPFDPHDFTQSPCLSYLATRELTYLSVM